MDDRRCLNALQYGHLGTAFYLPDTQTWEFTRHPRKGPSFSLLEESLVSAPEPNPIRSSYAVRLEAPRKKEQALLREYPELAPSLELVESHDKSSRVIASSVTNFDPLVSVRLPLGKPVPADGSHITRGAIPIVVMASGDPATSIALIPIEAKEKSLPAGPKQPVTLPILDCRSCSLWSCPYGPVQQICFAESIEEDSKYFAARFAQVTTIFRPLHHRVPLVWSFGTRGFNLNAHSKATLSANPLLDIPISLTGGHSHVDITFNPWWQQQLAVIDRCGNWSVWIIPTILHRKTDLAAERGPYGSLASAVGSSVSKVINKDHFDGWAAISWAGNVHSVLVCDRRNLVLCMLNTVPPEQFPVDLGLLQGSEWILDISRSKSNASHVFVLTTAKVYWLNVSSDSKGDQSVSILLSWKHFRDIEDTSLRLTQILAQNGLSIVIFSRFNDLAQGFRFSVSPDESSIPVSASDPFMIPVPRTASDVDQPENSRGNCRFSSILFKEIESSPASNDQEGLREPAIIKFIGESTGLETVEGLYSVAIDHDLQQGGYSRSDSFIPRKRGGMKIKSERRVHESDFVVYNMGDSAIRLGVQSGQTRDLRGQLGQPLKLPQRVEQWEKEYSYVFSGIPESISGRDAKGAHIQEFDDWIGLAIDELQSRVPDGTTSITCQTLLEALGVPPSIDAIDSNAGSFDRFLRAMDAAPESQQYYRLSALPFPVSATSRLPVARPARPARPDDLSLTALYDSLVYDWLSPLSEHVPNRVRIFKERMIRSVVTEIMFSRMSLVSAKAEESGMTNLGEKDSGYAESAVGSQKGSSMFAPSQESALSSQDIESSRALDSSESTEPAFHFLRRYTTVNPQGPPSKRVMTTISHWKTGTDPSSYNWDKTVRKIEEEQSQAEQHPAARRRRRREERKRLQMKSAGKQTLSQPTTPRVSESMRMWGSQPDKVSGAASSIEPGLWSSQAKDEEIPLTQVERGVFGSREASRKKVVKERKKRRAAGF